MAALLAYTAFAIGVASPGPSVLAVMGTAMAQGRTRALALASGIVCGSLCWGLSAAFGLAALMERWSGALAVVRAIGGLYLLWMAWQAARRVRGAARATTVEPVREGYARTCARGLAMHLTNPKSIVVWLSVVSLALPTGARQADALAFVLSCATLSATIFCCYALAFSTHAARRAYSAGERWVNAALAGVFGYAGMRMLLASQAP
ncbi:LysE family translocator [Massilia rhizosphaerae]|uniref:LysE family translocator n=1 Tax=Massilia rhizosphaerae TaxID=2784389 RepID=UPI0018DC15D6|nr:LysE family translocator [Massilia rhizosphaerae]